MLSGSAWIVWLGSMSCVMSSGQQLKVSRGPDAIAKNLAAVRDVRFETEDGVQIAGTFYVPTVAEGANAPAAILVHMYPADRHSWKPLAEALQKRGVAVLAYDIRGKGDSAGDRRLARRYNDRDGQLFTDAWKDAAAAVKWLGEQKGVNADRIAMVGASIGCSISLEYATKNEHVKSVTCLSPGTNYFGVNSIQHIEQCGGRDILLIAPEGERAAPEELAKHGENVTVQIKPGTKLQHGTAMFGESYGPELIDFIARFVEDTTTMDAEGKKLKDEDKLKKAEQGKNEELEKNDGAKAGDRPEHGGGGGSGKTGG